jgi:gluconate 2-dehydrogenase gamma chain
VKDFSSAYNGFARVLMDRGKMNRREALRRLAAGAVMPLMPHPRWVLLRQAREDVGAPVAPRTLNPHQYATVKAMAEMIIPKTDTPGATDVGAIDFIDLLLTEWYDGPARDRFLSGVADVDAQAQSLFGKKMVDCSAAQQAAMLRALGEEMAETMTKEQAPEALGESEPPEPFYPMLRRMTLTAYYTSEAGATDELHFEIVPGRYDGCAEAPGDKEAERQ